MNDNGFESITDALHAEDLLALERRGQLNEHEQRRLGMCLMASDALRILRQLHQDFEALNPTEDDEALITEQCVSAVKHHFSGEKLGSRRRRLPLQSLLAGACTVLLTVAAAAALYRSVTRPVTPEKVAATSAIEPIRAKFRAPERVLESRAAPAESIAAAPIESPQANRVPEPSAAIVGGPKTHSSRGSDSFDSTAAAAAISMSPVELFAAANAARRNGQTQKAIALYQRLQAEHPASEEALVSHVLLARLELGHGAAAAALREFDAYLERVPRGSLSQEALQGRAQALSRLGRKQEETAAWHLLLKEFPNSVYARSAREHLGEGSR